MVKVFNTVWFVFVVMFITFMLWTGINNEHHKKQCVESGGYPVAIYWQIECVEIGIKRG